jgi:PDZ domain-containing protein
VSRRTLTLLLSSGLVLALVLVVAVVRVPYVALAPGPTFNTLGLDAQGKPVISVTGHKTYDDSGHLNMTTISVVVPLTLPGALRGWFRHDQAVVPRDAIYPPGKSTDEVRKQDEADFKESQTSATTAALRYLGIKGTVRVLVGSVRKGAPADGKLKAGDVILNVDGKVVHDAKELVALVGARAPGQSVRLGVTRGRNLLTLTVVTAAVTEPDGTVRAVIGVTPKEQINFPVKVTISLADIGGPSAGLMFALGIVDKLEPGSLTHGRFIAGTGTIDDEGTVGPIGGIQQKLIGAKRHGASVFLVPADNCAEALSSPPDGLRLVKVASLRGAVSELEKLDKGTATTPCTKKAA